MIINDANDPPVSQKPIIEPVQEPVNETVGQTVEDHDSEKFEEHFDDGADGDTEEVGQGTMDFDDDSSEGGSIVMMRGWLCPRVMRQICNILNSMNLQT